MKKSPEPRLPFSQRKPYAVQNHMLNPILKNIQTLDYGAKTKKKVLGHLESKYFLLTSLSSRPLSPVFT